MRSELSENVRSQIVILSREGLSQRQIMERLQVSKGGVHGTLRRVAETGSVVSKARSGRPKVTTPSEDHYIQLSSLTNRKPTSSQILNVLNKERETPISRSTVKRRLHRGARGGGRVSTPPVSRGHRARRLEWARKHQHLTADDWRRVLFTGETTIRGHDPAEPHAAAGLRVWGCFSHSGVGALHRLDSPPTDEHRHLVLQRHAVPSGVRLCGQGFTLLQDADAGRPSTLCGGFLKSQEQQGVLTLGSLPPHSPDLNPLQHLLGHLRTEEDKHHGTSQDALWLRLQAGWDSVAREVLTDLVASMPARVHAVVRAKGGRTKYS